ncbi:Protein of unknown function [Mesobacillus persicus]|uniref:DUF3397 domain-containing protein n=1 Tax=Mesobacillus persicus TaxID=930146 RepID=A0A1H8FCA7_9BACI|nr:DUF3397 domain-containing protein [Mesobacillus persicus]SEN29463.1 Protein of unknown function [Mesobacillus persicus]
MTGFLSVAVATLVTLPLVGYVLIFIFSKQLTKNHKRSVQRAIDFSTLLLIVSNHFLILVIWEKSFLWLILLILIFMGIIFVIYHWKYRQEIDYFRVFKGYWRMNFLLFFTAYIVLIIYGMVQRVSGIVLML